MLYPCRDPSGNEGVTVAAPLSQASINYILNAYGPSGTTVLATVSGASTIPQLGAQSTPVTLQFLLGTPSTTIDVSWSFGGQSCSASGVTAVTEAVQNPSAPSNGFAGTAACTASGVDGTQIVVSSVGESSAAGEYPVSLNAPGTSATFTAQASVVSNGFTASQLLVDLSAQDAGTSTVGTLTIGYSFAGQSCGAAGVDTVAVQLVTAFGTALVPAVQLPCADAGTSYTFAGVPAPATAFVWTEGLASGRVISLAAPQAYVAAGTASSYAIATQAAP